MKNIAEKIDYGRYAFTSTVIMESVFSDLIKNNTYIPCIKRVIYNLGKKAYPKLDENGKRIRKTGPDGKPIKQLPKASGKQLRDIDMFEYSEPVDVLATVVYFDDDTKISVVNSVADGVKFEDAVVGDATVKTATRESKEIGLVYAIVKRLCAKFDPNTGKMTESGIGRILNDVIKNSYDSPVEAAKLKLAKAKSKAEHEAKLNTAKPKENYSIKGTLERINKMLDKVESGEKLAGLDKMIEKINNIKL
jgi:hypothetical protein